MPRQQRRVAIPAPTRGMRYTTDVFSIRPDQAYLLRNLHLDAYGNAKTRRGCRRLNATAFPDEITSIYDYRRPDGNRVVSILLVTAGKGLYRYDETLDTYTLISNLSSSERPSWVTFTDGAAGSVAIMANGSDFLKYNGTAVTNVSASYPWVATDAPRYIIEYDDRLLASGCAYDPYKVFVSAALDGTNWLPGSGSTAVYWTVKGQKGERVTGLGVVYDFGVIFQEHSVNIITEADPDSSTSQQITVSTAFGASSHWSINTVNNILYFADQNNIYRGVLRESVENGLLVAPISDNVQPLYLEAINRDTVQAIYDPEWREMHFAITTSPNVNPNRTLVYSERLSSYNQYGSVDVWPGIFESNGYQPHTMATVIRPDAKTYIYFGTVDGFIYIYGEDGQYKDQRMIASVLTSYAIPSEIVTGAIAPGDITVAKSARQITVKLFQRYDNSTFLQYIIDGTYVKPASGEGIDVTGLVPNWRASTTTTETQTWNGTVWNDTPYIPRPVSLFDSFKYIQFRIYCAGTNTRDEIGYSGAELWFQLFGIRRTQG